MASRNRTTEENTIENKKYYSKRNKHTINNKRRYTEIELNLIKQHLITDTELSLIINRSVMAIQICRHKLNKQNGKTTRD